MSRRARYALIGGGVIVALLLIAVTAALILLPSQWFRDKMRHRLVYELERVTGGEVEIGSFQFDWRKLQASVQPFVLHGTEPAGERPLFRAQSLQLTLKLVSALKRDVDIHALVVDQPEVNILVNENGITNFPTPKIKRERTKDPVEQLLDLAVREFTVRNGYVRYADKKVAVEMRGRNLNARLAYDFTGPRYVGEIKFTDLGLDSARTLPMHLTYDSKVALERNRLVVENARLAMKRSSIVLRGEITNFADPHARFDTRIMGNLAELGKPLKISQPESGEVTINGALTYSAGESYQFTGKMRGQEVVVRSGRLRIPAIKVISDLKIGPKDLQLRGVQVSALDGAFRGSADIQEFNRFKINGQVEGISLRTLSRLQGLRTAAWNGRVSGPVEITGSLRGGAADVAVGGKFKITPVPGEIPVEGTVEIAWDRRRALLQVGNSFLTLPSSTARFSGTPGRTMTLALESRDLNDFLPPIAMFSEKPPRELPVKLKTGGVARFDGTVTGQLSNAQIAGKLQVTNFEVQGRAFDGLVAAVNVNNGGAKLSAVALAQGTMRIEGDVRMGLVNWRPTAASPLEAKVRVRNAEVERLTAETGRKVLVTGTLNATLDVRGTWGNPQANAQLVVDKITAYGEQFDQLRAEVRYAGTGVEVINGELDLGTARILLAGAYEHPVNDWKNGQFRFDLSSRGLALAQINRVQKLQPEVRGSIAVKAVGAALVRDGNPLLSNLDGRINVQSLVIEGKPIGNFAIDASTRGGELTLRAGGDLRGAKVSGNGTFQLAGDYPGRGHIEFSPLTFSTIRDLVSTARAIQPLPFDGVIAGRIEFSGPIRKPELLQARAEFPTLEIVPARGPRAGQENELLALRNEGPIVVEMDGKGLHVRSAHLVGTDTDLQAAGTLNFREKTPWDLRVSGNVNLATLEKFNPRIVSAGAVALKATVRGTLRAPQVFGRAELKNASFYWADLPNGIDQANGTIEFDRNRATIERLTAKTGGGDLRATGFVGYGAGGMTYRIQVEASRVRVRYPEGVSTTINAVLSTGGGTARGLLAGVVTIQRAGFNPRTDVGSLLARSVKPVQTPTTPNEFVRNLQLDVRVESVPNLQFQTALTSDLQAEADLRIRGTAAKPAVLGRITISQGEIQLFGNRYQISRGEIGFFNPVRIEPILDLDLETRVRGVLVNISLAGPLHKLNVSYRSDPPLQSSEIIALLAVGRAPGANTVASSQVVTNQSFLQTGTSTLLGQAISQPLSSRLQRFFGVSRVKIDPNLTNLDAVPQARLTLEQQISKDLTLTYITNLTQTNQQIVRLEWDLNRTWSLIAVREENGVFGIDFQYKKRLR